jgi:hypothetical protein
MVPRVLVCIVTTGTARPPPPETAKVRIPPIGIVIKRFLAFVLFKGFRKTWRFTILGNERRFVGFAMRLMFAESDPMRTGGALEGFGLFDFATVVRPFVRR